jgi:hypothetical protein
MVVWDERKKGPVMRPCVKAKVVGQPAGASLHGKVVNENSRANLRAFQMLDFVAILVYIRAPAHYRIMQAFEPHRFLVL